MIGSSIILYSLNNAYVAGHEQMLSNPLGPPMNRNLLGFGIRHGAVKRKRIQSSGGPGEVLGDWERRGKAYERR